ncbi:hypothetical protein [Streptomyces sp. ATCC 21386]|uniref:hypothetical protein n=1 Tax=Streptomyces sp. ATCC 21386 TaxID=2699428 RepID=UPI001BFF9D8F|nr:hypothetical protein [Streptomyces sp. ATCC 21386]
MTRTAQVVVIGGGQSELTAGYHLRRQGLDRVILRARTTGGTWQNTRDSLYLCSPAAPLLPPRSAMPPQVGQTHPDAQHVVEYLADQDGRPLSGMRRVGTG